MDLDPTDWPAARAEAHRLLDACLDRLEGARDLPWQPVDAAARAALMPDLPEAGMGLGALGQALAEDVMRYATGNTHPRFFGWVHGTGLMAGLMADMAASAMNANCGGRDHGAVYVERAVVDWCRRIFGLPEGTAGLLTPGTSMACLLALAAARARVAPEARAEGTPALVGYATEGAHSAHAKAFELMGLGSRALRHAPPAALPGLIAADRAAGRVPFVLVGSAGTVDTGAFDDLAALANLAEAEGLWFHIDGAFGAWLRIAEAPWRGLTEGIERATSLAFDFHKWPYVQYDAGMALVRDGAALRAAFATRPAYLAGQRAGLGGGDPWFCDLGVDLSRGFRALRVWSALRTHGLAALGAAVTENCRHAAHMADRVAASGVFALAAPVVSNVCCFRPADPALVPLVPEIAIDLQLSGAAVLSTTVLDGRPALRAAIVNHRTRMADIDLTVAAAAEALAARA